jgi:hypothetical protein
MISHFTVRRVKTTISCLLIACFNKASTATTTTHLRGENKDQEIHHKLLYSLVEISDPKIVTTKAVSASSDIAVAVVSNKDRQEATVRAIRDTWGSDFPVIEYVSSTESVGLITAVVSTNEAYACSSWEEMNALKYLHDHYPNTPWYMKTDDYAYVNAKALTKALESYDSNEDHYLGVSLTYNRSPDADIEDCAAGVGYLISNSAMKKIYTRLLDPFNSCYSDVQVGRLLSEEMKNPTPCALMKDVVAFSHMFKYHVSRSETGTFTFDKEDANELFFDKVVGYDYVTAEMQYALRSLHTNYAPYLVNKLLE